MHKSEEGGDSKQINECIKATFKTRPKATQTKGTSEMKRSATKRGRDRGRNVGSQYLPLEVLDLNPGFSKGFRTFLGIVRRRLAPISV